MYMLASVSATSSSVQAEQYFSLLAVLKYSVSTTEAIIHPPIARQLPKGLSQGLMAASTLTLTGGNVEAALPCCCKPQGTM